MLAMGICDWQWAYVNVLQSLLNHKTSLYKAKENKITI